MSRTPLSILILGDSVDDASRLVQTIKSSGFALNWQRAEIETEYRVALSMSPDIIFADANAAQLSVPRTFEILRECKLDIPVIILTKSGREEVGMESLASEAADVLPKDRLDLVRAAVRRALLQIRLKAERRSLEEQLQQAHKMEAIGWAAGGVALEINNVLMGIMIEADLSLSGANLNPELQESLREIKISTERAVALAQRLLSMSQSWGSQKQTAIQPGEPARPRDLRGGTETILLVESDPHLRRLMSLALVRHGYQILPATDSTAALHAWSEHPRQIHLLFTGIKFPSGSSGVDLAAQLRVCQRGLKVLFMSADPADLATIQSAGQPSQNFLLKPVSLSELLETIRKTLDSCD